MKRRLIEYLNRKGLKFWTFESISSSCDELYKIGKEVESRRKVRDLFYQIKVYVDNGDFTGSAFVKLPNGVGLSEAEILVDRAIENAKSIQNQRYSIEQARYEYENRDNIIDLPIEEFHIELESALLSSSEFFIRNYEIEFQNSAGNYYISRNGIVMSEVVLLSPNMEVETYYLKEAPSIASLDLKESIRLQERFTLDLLEAELPKSGIYDVIFNEEILENLFSFFIFHSLGSSFYNGYSLFKPGEHVGMEITISSDPSISGLNSAPADELGYPLKRFEIIENGILKNVVANNKYSQYLGLPFTGELSNLVIKEGAFTEESLLEEGSMIISKVSAFSPDEATGDFSAEIRLGYLIQNGKRVPIKGGSFSGNIRDYKEIFLSKDVIQYNSYIGPKACMLRGVNITGRD